MQQNTAGLRNCGNRNLTLRRILMVNVTGLQISNLEQLRLIHTKSPFAKKAKGKARSCPKDLIIKRSLHYNCKLVAHQTLQGFVTSPPTGSFSEHFGSEGKSWKIYCSNFINSYLPRTHCQKTHCAAIWEVIKTTLQNES